MSRRIYRVIADGVATAGGPVALPNNTEHAYVLMTQQGTAGLAAPLLLLVPDASGSGVQINANSDGAFVSGEVPFVNSAPGHVIWRQDEFLSTGNRAAPLATLGWACVLASDAVTPAPLPAGTIIEFWAT